MFCCRFLQLMPKIIKIGSRIIFFCKTRKGIVFLSTVYVPLFCVAWWLGRCPGRSALRATLGKCSHTRALLLFTKQYKFVPAQAGS